MKEIDRQRPADLWILTHNWTEIILILQEDLFLTGQRLICHLKKEQDNHIHVWCLDIEWRGYPKRHNHSELLQDIANPDTTHYSLCQTIFIVNS